MAVDPVLEAPPQYQFVRAEGLQQLVIELPGVQSLAGVELDIGQTEVQLQLPGGSSSLIALPQSISCSSEAHAGVAKFSKKRGQLTISWNLATPSNNVENEPSQEKAQPEAKVQVESVESRADCAELEGEPAAAETAVASHAAAESGKATSKAYGSLWNANSWHWEQKNCIEMFRDEVSKSLQQCMEDKLKHIKDLSGACVLLKDISVDGEASFTLRRGKRILFYEVSVSFAWEVRDAYGAPIGAKGKGKVNELTQDEESPQVDIEVSTAFSGGGEAKLAGEWMRRQGARAIGDFLAGPLISAAMQAAEDARANAAQDDARRKEERAKAESAQRATADEREQMAIQQRQLEEARRLAPADGAVQGSVWNANAWHWEEKPMTTWAHAWLSRKLEGLTASLLGGLATVAFANPQVSGDASVSVRKGRPIALFQIKIECTWSVAESTAGVGEARGTLLIPEFTSEDGYKSAIEVQAGSHTKKTAGQLVAGVRREGVPAVRTILAQFTDELKKQLDRSA